MPRVIGRERELRVLKRLLGSTEAQFLAIYGRRRVGKTFLIENYFQEKSFFFGITGIREGRLHDQLENFLDRLCSTFKVTLEKGQVKSWKEAFNFLTQEIQKIKNKKIVVFFDELPWLASKRSDFLMILDYFWNTEWKKIKNLILVICGSSASWMIKKIINDKGGLHNRLTQKILLEAFNLYETEKFLEYQSLTFEREYILNIYMTTGGIPYYLQNIPKGLSASQVIDRLCFKKDGLLFDEFDKLLQSLFESSHLHEKILKALSKKHSGLSRNEMIKNLKLKSSTSLNTALAELMASGFIHRFSSFSKNAKNDIYKVVDPYTLFYLYWIDPVKKDLRTLAQKGYWEKAARTPKVQSWAGYAFENVCFQHIRQIASALGLDQILWHAGSWRGSHEDHSAQIDLLFDREDGLMTLCEMKYKKTPFVIDRAEAKNLMHKMDVFQEACKTQKRLSMAMVCVPKLKANLWSRELIDHEVCLDDLFEP